MNAPTTPEGRAVVDALDRWGIWRRAGMTGLVVGLDIAEALAGMPDGLDRDFLKRLLIAAENAFVSAHIKRQATENNGTKQPT